MEKAKEHYLSRLQKEWSTSEQQQQGVCKVELPSHDVRAADPLRIADPASSFVKRKVRLQCWIFLTDQLNAHCYTS